ncbi:MAG: hypothetical protein PVJ38_06240 [Candidatus Bathyarchaeota archaeon]
MTEELKGELQKSKRVLENYRWFGKRVEEAIAALDIIDRYIDDPTPEERPRIVEIVTQMREELGPYKGFVPVVVDTMSKVQEWLDT